MEQHFIAITEKAPKLTMLEDGLAREFLAEYDCYENRVEDINNVVPMRRFLEKADILELLDATEGITQCQMVRAPGPAPVAGGVAAALAAEDASDREEESDKGEEEEDKIYTILSNEHVIAMLISYLGPTDVVASGEMFDGIRM